MARADARWRPPNRRRPLSWYLWMAWTRLALVAIVATTTIHDLVRGGNGVLDGGLLFVFALIGSTEVWKLQGIHAMKRERAKRDDVKSTTPPSTPGG